MYNFEESIQRYLDIVGPMTSSEFKEYLKKDVSQMSSLEYELYSIKRKTEELRIKNKKIEIKQKMERNIVLLNKRYSAEEICDIERDVSESLEILDMEFLTGTIKIFIEYSE